MNDELLKQILEQLKLMNQRLEELEKCVAYTLDGSKERVYYLKSSDHKVR